MKVYNYKPLKTNINNPINYNILKKQKIPRPSKNISLNNKNSVVYGNKYYFSNLININENTKIEENNFFNSNSHRNNFTNNINSNIISSFENITPNNNQDINFIKMKLGFDLLTKKINMINDQIQIFSDSNKIDNKIIRLIKTNTEKVIKVNKINKSNILNNNSNIERMNILTKNNRSSQSQKYFLPYSVYNYNIDESEKYYNNFNIQDNNNNILIPNHQNKINNNFFNNKNNQYSDYNSLQRESMKIINDNNSNIHKYNSFNNLRLYKTNNNNNNNNIYNNSFKISNSVNNANIPICPTKLIKKKNSFNASNYKKNKNNQIKNIKNINICKDNQNQINSTYFFNKRINNFIQKDTSKEFINNYNNNINNNDENKNNDSFVRGTHYGSFDKYFLENQSSKKQEPKNNNNRINILYKNQYSQNNHEIFSIINKEKIIPNNNYLLDNNDFNREKISNINLIVENQNSISFLGNEKMKTDNHININKNNIYEETETFEENEEPKKREYQQNKLQKCSASNIFFEHNKDIKINTKNNIKNNNYNNNDDIVDKKDNFHKKSNKNIISKDDFYYDLFTEKIIEVNKINNSIDEEYKLLDIKKRFYDKLENKFIVHNNDKGIINIQIKNGEKDKSKKVRFFEGDNHYIQFNLEEKVSKFNVLNHLGNKIYFKHFNIEQYNSILKSKNSKKSILLIKNIDNSDNSEWNKLFKIINQIKYKNDKIQGRISSSDKIKKNFFKIKNIESFRENGMKIHLKKNLQKDNINKKNTSRQNEDNKIKVKRKENAKNKSNKYNIDDKNKSFENRTKNKINNINKK